MEQLVDNRYRIVRTLGSGGMADVFLAHDDVLDRNVALKVMNSRYAGDDEFVERFRREAQSAAALSHSSIVSIYDRGESKEGTYYIAMEYLPGGTLKDRILKRGAIPAKTAAEVAVQIAEALKVAHDRGVVHRDIKPHNILITESGDIKVTDFGIARAASSSTMTKTGAVMGTAHYISPEQAMGESVGPASDLYSLGVLLYEMLTGELPFDADTPIGIAMKHVNSTPPPPKEVNPGVPAGLNAIVVKLLQKRPEDRYASDADLIEDLERAARGETPAGAAVTQAMDRVPTSGTRAMAPVPPGVGPQNQKKRRRTAPILFLGLILLVLIGVGGYALSQALQDPQTDQGSNAREFDVPDLSGMTLDAAKQQVGERFDVTRSGTEDGPQQSGEILSQRPESGGKLDEGSEIQVTTASGRNQIPDVRGNSEDSASQTLSRAGFDVSTERRESDADEEGDVLSQDPESGSTRDVGETVKITIGSGVATVQVPNIPTGSSRSESQSILEDANLKLGGVTTYQSNDVPEGGIIDQSPNPGEEVEEDSAVDIVLSSGPEQVRVPDLVGQPVDAAQQTLSGLGLTYTTSEAQSSEPEGTVLSTDPSGNSTVDAGSAVNITYSVGQPEETTAPEETSESNRPNNENDRNNGGLNIPNITPESITGGDNKQNRPSGNQNRPRKNNANQGNDNKANNSGGKKGNERRERDSAPRSPADDSSDSSNSPGEDN